MVVSLVLDDMGGRSKGRGSTDRRRTRKESLGGRFRNPPDARHRGVHRCSSPQCPKPEVVIVLSLPRPRSARVMAVALLCLVNAILYVSPAAANPPPDD